MSGLTFAEPPSLADLLPPAGASDQDRDAWLAERRTGITATLVRDLWLAKQKGEGSYRKMLAVEAEIKLGMRPDPFQPTKYTVWGKAREPEIADAISWNHEIRWETRVFHHRLNPRWMASPDGTGVIDGELVLSEIKTSKHAKPVGSERFIQSGYLAQMVWQMLVMGASRCLYRWEQHNDDWSGAEVDGFRMPTGVLSAGEHWVAYDPKLAAELVYVADEFLAVLDETAAAGVTPDPDDYEVLVAAYLRACEHLDRATAMKKAALDEILRMSGGRPGFHVTTSQAKVAMVTPNPRVTFDEAAWARRAPAQHRAFVAAKAKFRKESPSTPYVRVTPIKGEEDAE